MKFKDYVKKLNEILEDYDGLGEFETLNYDYQVNIADAGFCLGWFYDGRWIREGDGQDHPEEKLNAIMF